MWFHSIHQHQSKPTGMASHKGPTTPPHPTPPHHPTTPPLEPMPTTTTRAKTKTKYDGPTPEEKLAADLVALMESADLPPWRKEWTATSGNHRNLCTGAEYSGSNPLLLELGSMIQGHTLPLWLGAAQAKALNWWPKKGSTCCRILRPQANSYTETEQDPSTGKDVDVTRAWTSYKAVAVFNAADFKGVDETAEQALQAAISSALGRNTTKPQAERLHLAEQVLEAWLVPTTYGGAVACYSPQLDQIRMPPPESFNDRESFVATWAHEQAHSTGHKARLNRPQHGSQGSKPYAFEELVAELASVLICYRLQVGCCLTNHAAYLKQWAAILQAEPGSLFKVLGKARAAADLITNTNTTTTPAEVLL